MIAAIIQARMGSTRLPGKVLKEICGKPLLELLIERVRYCGAVESLVVATSDDTSDDRVEMLAHRLGVKCYRGSQNNVLDRFCRAAQSVNAGHVIRITGDCPLIDPRILGRVIEKYCHGMAIGQPFDYVSNTLIPTFPDGLDVEIFSHQALERMSREASRDYHFEHVTAYAIEHREQFKTGNVRNAADLSHLRWTVDTAEDFELVKAVFEGLYPSKRIFLMDDILEYLTKNPALKEINKKFKRNEGFEESLIKRGVSPDDRKVILSNMARQDKINEI